MVQPADWRSLAAIPTDGKSTAGLAGSFSADSLRLLIVICFHQETDRIVLPVFVFVTQERRRARGARLPNFAVLGISMRSQVMSFEPAAQIDPSPDQMSRRSDGCGGDDEKGAVSALGHGR